MTEPWTLYASGSTSEMYGRPLGNVWRSASSSGSFTGAFISPAPASASTRACENWTSLLYVPLHAGLVVGVVGSDDVLICSSVSSSYVQSMKCRFGRALTTHTESPML